jgi:hypothetical protein
MKKRARFYIALLFPCALVVMAGCERAALEAGSGDAAPSAQEITQVTAQGEAAANALMERLGAQLKGALESGGPVAAITVCQQVALPLTTAAGSEFEGVTIKRTTLKPRNPANAPDDRDRAVLMEMSAQSPPQPVIRWEDGVAHYYRPLIVQEVCLKCHGDPATFPKELSAALAAAYPADEATGYALGDLRGAIRVTIDAP